MAGPQGPLVMTLQLDTGPLLYPVLPTVFGNIGHFMILFDRCLSSGLGAGLGWLLTRGSLAVSELGSPTVNVPVTFTNNNNPTITADVDVDVAATNTNNDNDQIDQDTTNTNNNSNGKRRKREITM